MKHEIVYTDDYALIVSDEQIEDVRPFIGRYHLEKGNMIYQFPTYLTDLTYCKLIIAHRPLKDAPILEGVSLLREFGQEDDVEKIADVLKVGSTYRDYEHLVKRGIIIGYNKAKETYKYTEEDVIVLLNRTARKYFNEGREHKGNMAIAGDPLHGVRRELISMLKSLQQPKRPKYFECEMEPKYKHIGAVKGIYGSGFRKKNLMYGLPKTITNSQGQKELVGSYIY